MPVPEVPRFRLYVLWLPRAAVGQVVRRARLRGAEGHLAAVLGVAGAGLDALPLVELLAGGGVGDDVQLVRGAVVLEAADDRLVGEGRRAASPAQITLRGARSASVFCEPSALAARQRPASRRSAGGDVGGGGRRPSAAALVALVTRSVCAGLGVVDDQVAAEDGSPA